MCIWLCVLMDERCEIKLTVKRSFSSIALVSPFLSHFIVGLGSPSARQWSIVGEFSIAVVFFGATLNQGFTTTATSIVFSICPCELRAVHVYSPAFSRCTASNVSSPFTDEIPAPSCDVTPSCVTRVQVTTGGSFPSARQCIVVVEPSSMFLLAGSGLNLSFPEKIITAFIPC